MKEIPRALTVKIQLEALGIFFVFIARDGQTLTYKSSPLL